jgi:hypothetical protein
MHWTPAAPLAAHSVAGAALKVVELPVAVAAEARAEAVAEAEAEAVAVAVGSVVDWAAAL